MEGKKRAKMGLGRGGESVSSCWFISKKILLARLETAAGEGQTETPERGGVQRGLLFFVFHRAALSDSNWQAVEAPPLCLSLCPGSRHWL